MSKEELDGKFPREVYLLWSTIVKILISRECLNHFRTNKVDFVRQFIITVESWIQFYYINTTKSKQWPRSGFFTQKGNVPTNKGSTELNISPNHHR